MPLYDFKCHECGTVSKDVWMTLSEFSEQRIIKCMTCKRNSVHELVYVAPAVDDWGDCGDGRYFENLSPTGERFRDKKSFKAYLREHGLREKDSYVG